MANDVIAAIRGELARLGATYPSAPAVDEVTVRDDGSGDVTLRGSPRGIDFLWSGREDDCLRRLRGLPDPPGGFGAEMIRSEFAA